MNIYRLSDRKLIGTVSEEHPHEIAFTNQAVLVDRDFLSNHFTQPLTLMVDKSKGNVKATAIQIFKPEDDEFFIAAISELPLKGYLVMKKEQPNVERV